MMKTYKWMILTAFSVMVVLSSCSGELDATSDNTTGDAEGVTVNIQALPSSQTRTVTAGGTSAGTSDEWIKTYTVVILDNNSKTVEAVITRPVVNTSLVQSEEYKLVKEKLAYGEKTIFALGNISLSQAGITVTAGDVLTDAQIGSLKNAVYDFTTGNGFNVDATSNRYIPMSNWLTESISVTDNTLDVPLYRMLAKLEFTFSNSSDVNVTVNSVKLSSITKDNINLFPIGVNFDGDRTDYAKAPTFPSTSTATEYSSAVGTTIPQGESITKTFYVNESKGDVVSKLIGVTINSQYDGISAEDNYALSDLAYINRNDYIKIPIDVTGYIFTPTALYYPPIGGYPEVNITKTDGKYCFTFDTGGGSFSISPNFRKVGSETPISFSSVAVTCSNPTLFTKNQLIIQPTVQSWVN